MVASLCEAVGSDLPSDYEQNLATARAGLGEEAFASAWQKGQAMPLADAIASASPTAVAA
jgi:hypothetical protein